jgi:hypothetical protein
LVPIKEISKNRAIFLGGNLRKAISGISVPLYLLGDRSLTVLEALIEYLKEHVKLNYRQIGVVLKRDERNIRDIYLHAKEKRLKSKFRAAVPEKVIHVPVSIFADRKVSALEALVAHLHVRLGFSYHEIAVMLNRDDRTVWTCYHRFKQKTRRRYER